MARVPTEQRVRRPRAAGALLLAALLIMSDARAAAAATAPTVGGIVAPLDPVPVGSVVAASGEFTDPDSTTHTAVWSWGDGSTTLGTVALGTVTGSHAYARPGVFRIGLDVRDESGATGSAVFEFVVVYDPSAGFVTGGGWIDSPPGAYPADPTLTGRASFGLVAKYKTGTSTPDGTTEFQFRAADLSFHSVDYEWLVVAGARAQFKGTGTIQGRDGLFRFFVTAIDGDLLGGGALDRFRIKILDMLDDNVLYDNLLGATDDADPVMALGGGSIVIHKSKADKPLNQPPVATDDSYAASEDTPLAVAAPGVLANDSDADGDALSAALVGAPAHGTLTLNASGSFTYTPAANFNGTDTFTYQACDAAPACDTATVTVTVSAVNDPPIADAGPDQTAATGQLVTLDGSGSSDPEGGTVTYRWTVTTRPTGSSSSPSDPTSVMPTFTPDLAGTYVIELVVGDGSATDADEMTLTVSQTDRAPVAADDSYSVAEDSVLTVAAPGVLANDSDADGDPLSALLVSGPAHGTLTLGANGSFVYTPNANYAGPDSFTYQASDGTASSGAATVHIDVTAVNDPPDANDDVATTPEDTAVMISVLANDGDVDGAIDLTSFTIVTPPVHGTTQMADPATLLIRYTPFTDFQGTDTFTYRICDSVGACDTALVTVTVVPLGDAPVALPDAYSVAEDSVLAVAAPGVLANDTDADGDALTAILFSGPAHGSLTFNTSGAFTYTPLLNFAGVDEFRYVATDGSATSSNTTVTITVVAVNDPPVANAGPDQAATSGQLVTLDGSGSSDPDGGAVTYSWTVTSRPVGSTSALVDPTLVNPTLTPDRGGVYVISLTVSDGSLTSAPDEMMVTANTPPTVDAGPDRDLVAGGTLALIATFTDPDAAQAHTASIDWGDGTTTPGIVDEVAHTISGSHLYALQGTFTLSVVVADSLGATGGDSANVTVGAANQAPAASNDAYGALEDTTFIVPAPGVLSNDTDVNGDTLTAVLVSGPTHGSLILNANGSFTYTPAPNLNGLDGFTYQASDGAALSTIATVSINVAAVNDAPDAHDDTATTNEDTAAVIDVLANDTDIDGSLVPASVSVTIGAAHGATTVDPATGAVTYTPQANFHGDDTFTYQVCDTASACDTAVVAITVLPLNDPPTADAGDDQTSAIGQLVRLDGSASDPDGDTLTTSWSIITTPTGSGVVLSDPSSLTPTFTPDLGGLYRFQLTVNDGTASSTDTVGVTVLGAITLTPDPLNLQTNATGSLTVTLSASAGIGGQLVDLASANATIASVPTSVLVPQDATSAAFDVVTGTLGGTVLVTASASGFTSDSATVNVGERALTLAIEDELVGVGRTTDALVTLSSPAPVGGTVVTLTMANGAIATVAPQLVTIAAGTTQGTAVVTGVAVGTTTLTASAPGYTSAVANVNVTDALISIGFIPEIGPDEVEGVPISLTKPAPPGGLTISLVTDDPSIATITPSVTVPAGGFLPPANPQVTGHSFGTTELVATAPGFAPDRRNVVVALHLSFSPATLLLGAATTRDITLNLSATAPVGGLNVALDTDHHAVATVPVSITIPQGQTSVVVPVTGISNGTTTLRASSPGITQATASIVVGAPITISPRNIGKDLQRTLEATLAVPAPAGNLQVTFTSADPSKLVISSIQTAAGASSTTVQTTAGQTFTPSVYLQALAGSGTVLVTASAPGYADGTTQVTLTPSGFRIAALPFFTSSFTTTTFAGNTQISLRSSRLNSSLQLVEDQEVRGGLTVDVAVASSNTAVGVITTSPVHFVGGTGTQKFTEFDPLSSSVSTISYAVPAGFSTPTTFQTVTATVDAPNILINAVTVGRDLQMQVGVSLENIPPAPVDVTVSVAPGGEGTVALSKTQTAAGSSSITFTGVSTNFAGNMYVQGLALGTTQLIATAAGYDAANPAMTVMPSGFYIFALPFAVSSFSTTTFASNTQIGLRTARLNASLQVVTEQELRGGLTVDVAVASSNTAVGVITTSPVQFVGGTGTQKFTAFDPLSSGVSTISYTVPAGFSTPTTFQTVTATVDAPDITIGAGSISVGKDLQAVVAVQLESAPPTPVDVTVTVVAGGEGTLAISKAQTAAGTATVTFTGVSTTFAGNIYVQGLALGSAQLTAAAANYNTGTAAVSVTPSGFWVYALPFVTTSFTTNTFAPDTAIGLRSSRLNSTFGIVVDQEVRGGLTVNVDVVSSQPTVGTITTSPVQFVGGTGGAARTTAFDPQTVGTSIISIPSPVPGFSVPATFQTVTANVRAPEVRIGSGNLSSHRIGRDLQVTAAVQLENAPPEPVDIILTVIPGGEGITSISKTQTAVGSNTLTFTGVTTTFAGNIYIQGRSLGSTQITGVAAGYNDAAASVSVEPSGFYISTLSGLTSVTTTAGAPNTTLAVRSAALDPVTLNHRADQEVRGGLSVDVSVTSSNPSVGTVTVSPLTFAGGTGTTENTAFDPASVGSSVVSIPTPVAGFSTISNRSATVTFTVNP